MSADSFDVGKLDYGPSGAVRNCLVLRIAVRLKLQSNSQHLIVRIASSGFDSKCRKSLSFSPGGVGNSIEAHHVTSACSLRGIPQS